MKHLALVTTSYPLSRDGSEAAGSFVEDFACALAEEVRVTVIAPALREDDQQIHPGLRVRCFAVPSLPLSVLKPWHPGHWPAIVKTLIAGQRAVRQALREDPAEHLLALWVLPSGWWARSATAELGIGYSTWALGSDIWTLGKLPVVRRLLQQVLRDAHANFADGYQLARDVERLSDRPCQFLPSARDFPARPDKQLATAPPYRLAFLGRWHRNKGVDLLLDALLLLSDDDWLRIAEVRIAGGGPLADLVRAQQAKLKERGRPVTLLGYLDKHKAAELFDWADYVLIPSRIESIPVVFSDAVQSSCPVVATHVGDLAYLLDYHKIGELAITPTKEAIRGAITRILGKTPNSFNQALKKAANEFCIKKGIISVLKLLKKTP